MRVVDEDEGIRITPWYTVTMTAVCDFRFAKGKFENDSLLGGHGEKKGSLILSSALDNQASRAAAILKRLCIQTTNYDNFIDLEVITRCSHYNKNEQSVPSYDR